MKLKACQWNVWTYTQDVQFAGRALLLDKSWSITTYFSLTNVVNSLFGDEGLIVFYKFKRE